MSLKEGLSTWVAVLQIKQTYWQTSRGKALVSLSVTVLASNHKTLVLAARRCTHSLPYKTHKLAHMLTKQAPHTALAQTAE